MNVGTLAPAAEAPAVESTPATIDAAIAPQTLTQFEEASPRARHRARSQQASPEDVPRIRELTKKLRDTEAALEATKTPAPVTPPAPVARPVVAAAPPPVKTADKDPEPTADLDPSTGKPYDDFNKLTRDTARWAARDEARTLRAQHDEAQRIETARADTETKAAAWTTNVAAAKTQFPDFEAIAYGPSEIPVDSLIDHWIREHPAGPKVLYSLKKNPTELRAMLALPLFEQTEALALLSQRLNPRVAAVSTGAAPVSDVKPVPRPPTPVRTGPMRTEPAVPDTDSLSLDDFAEATGAVKKRRA